MFRGFYQVEYPVYEVITPQTKKSYLLKTLTVSEEERLKGSYLNPTKLTEHLDRCIFDSIKTFPDNKVISFEEFLKSNTIKDRDALLYGLYHITYEEVRNYETKCSECGKVHQITINASSTFNMNPYPDEDILNKEIRIDLEKSKGVSVYVKQPTLSDELSSIKQYSSVPGITNELINETLIITKFSQEVPEAVVQNGSMEWTDKIDIIDAYKSLPAKDKRQIVDSYYENFGKYGIELKMKVICPSCGAEEIIDIDLLTQFFRMVFSS